MVKKGILAILFISVISTSFGWSEAVCTLGSTISSFCVKRPVLTGLVGFASGVVCGSGLAWLFSKVSKKQQPKNEHGIIIKGQTPTVKMCYEYPQPNTDTEVLDKLDTFLGAVMLIEGIKE